MGYVLDATTITWARERVRQLEEAEVDIGLALEHLAKVPEDLETGANKMDDQPDSDMMRSYAQDVRKLYEDLNRRFKNMVNDRRALKTAIKNFEGVKKNDC